MTTTADPDHDRNTQSFLVRLWRENPHDPWRVYVRNLQSNASQVFVTMNELFAYLESEGREQENDVS